MIANEDEQKNLKSLFKVVKKNMQKNQNCKQDAIEERGNEGTS